MSLSAGKEGEKDKIQNVLDVILGIGFM